MRPQVEVLEHHADLAAQLAQSPRRHRLSRAVLAGLVADELAFDPDLAFVVSFEEVDAAQQRALARAARSDQTNNLGARELEIDAVEHFQRAKAFGHAANFENRRAHAGPREEAGDTKLDAPPTRETTSTSSQ